MAYPGLHPYPHDPLPAVRCLLDYFRGTTTELLEVGHAAWHLAGYAYSMADVHPPVIGETRAKLSQAELREQLEQIGAQCSLAGFHASEFNWLSLAMALIELLKLLRS